MRRAARRIRPVRSGKNIGTHGEDHPSGVSFVWAVIDWRTRRVVMYANGVPACFKTKREAMECWPNGLSDAFRYVRLSEQERSA